ncbi:tetratricopeptide repeat protein [Thermococcus guaymasensis]|uniref:tetratricopeptide repeat protein n=1 Tax=Thermococcus guaymasensis TaxID=110164 RepID=UPI001FE1C5A9|nr:tetratricopeptide repeat protein [Thermococcus guaymasensis]
MEGVERFKEYLRLGNYRGAFAEALSVRDPLRRVIMITEIVARSYREEFVPQLLDTLREVKSPVEGAVAESYVARAFYTLEMERDGEVHFQRALELVERISSPVAKAEVLSVIGRNLVLSGRYTDGLATFRRAFELIQSARAMYSEVVSNLVNLARRVEKSAEEIPNEITLDFYRLAREIYESIGFKLQAKEIESKIRTAKEVFKRGSLAVTELLEQGNVDRAVQMARFLPPAERAVAMLNVAYWLFVHDYPDLAKAVFNDAMEILLVGKFEPRESELEAVAYRFLRIGKLEEALIIAGLLKDGKRFSELVGEIAVAYARRGELEYARELAARISDILIRDKTLHIIAEVENKLSPITRTVEPGPSNSEMGGGGQTDVDREDRGVREEGSGS